MSANPDLKPVLSFLSQLAKSNNRPWFEANRPAYERAKGLFEDFVDEVILSLGPLEDMRGVTAKDCVMRIYRDIRFSKDKSPYKTGMGASIGPGGRKSYRFHYYLHLQPHDESMIAGGLHEPESAQINVFRAAIDRNPRKFKAVLADKSFKRYFGEISGERTQDRPTGLRPRPSRDRPAASQGSHRRASPVGCGRSRPRIREACDQGLHGHEAAAGLSQFSGRSVMAGRQSLASAAVLEVRVERHPAVDIHGRTGNVAGGVRDQHHRHLGDLAGLCHSRQRDLR